MVDTVTYTCRYALHSIFPSDWKWSSVKGKRSNSTKFRRITLIHKPTRLVVYWNPKRTVVEVSLPKILYGTNARLITRQRELDKALREVDKLLKQIGNRVVTVPKRRFSRVDISWQVRGVAADFITAHYDIDHPTKFRGKRRPIIYRGESILWPGTECSLTLYDKLQKMRKGSGDILRIELRLRGGRLRRDMGDGETVAHLDVNKCYQLLRETVTSLQPKAVPILSDKSMFHYWAVKEKWKIHGTPAINVILRQYTSKRRKEAVRNIQSKQLSMFGIDWDKLVPAKRPRVLLVKKGCSYFVPRRAV